MINRRRSGVRGTPAKVNANAGLAASDKVNSASVSDGSHEGVHRGTLVPVGPIPVHEPRDVGYGQLEGRRITSALSS